MSERSIFLSALDIADPAQRSAYLDQACGNDAAQRHHIDELIAAEAKLGGFLARPHAALDVTGEMAPATERPGTIIGPYKLLQQIGEGGMGVVYMADQETPVRRRVALKIIKPGMDSRQVIARFEAERQALAMMDHQNIARVLDAGTTQSGRPYFVMELVHGVPLTRFCDDSRLTPRERLELFVPVCHAIQHAHQKGVIHRDIKPSNILVTMYDDKPVPKVIDFGVAKAVEQRLTEKTLFTQYGTLVGTFEYMSPEQAEMNAYGVDTRSDIYSLGVLLYELLTGTTPLERPKLREAAFVELVRMIKEEEPPRPSIRLSSTSTLPKFAAACRTEPARLSQLLRGELDWIIMKCLEKDRTRRYETANGLARDLQRYLSDEPVEACPPSAGYRLKKVLRRHKGPVLAAAMVLLTLCGGIIGTTWGLIRAEQSRRAESQQRMLAEAARERETARAESEAQQRRRAETAEAAALVNERQAATERDRAEQETRIAQAVKDFLQNRLLNQADARSQADALLEAGGSSTETKANPTIRELLDRAAAELAPAKIETKFPNMPLVQAEILRTIGNAYVGVRANVPAVAHLERSRDLYIAQLGPDHSETLSTLLDLAVAYRGTKNQSQALELTKQVYGQRLTKLGSDHPDTLAALDQLARWYRINGKLQGSVKLYEQVCDGRLAKLGPDHQDTLQSQSSLAWAYKAAGKNFEAVQIFEQVRDRQIANLGPVHPDTLNTLARLAHTYASVRRYPEAIQLFEQIRDPLNEMFGPDHPTTLLALRWSADVSKWAGKYPEAIRLYEEGRDKHIAKFGPDHSETMETLNGLADAYRMSRRLPEAIQLLEQERDRRTATLGPDHAETLNALCGLALAYHNARRLPEAIQLLEQVRDRRIAKLGPDHSDNLRTLTELAKAYWSTDRLPEAIQLLEQVRDQRLAKFPPDHLDTLGTMRSLALAYRDAGRLPEAMQLFEHVRDRYIATLGPDHLETLWTQSAVASIYRDADKLPEALQLYEETVQRARRVFGAGNETTAQFVTNWCLALDQAGQFGKSVEVQRELLKSERERFSADSPRLAGPLFRMGLSLLKAEQFGEAEPVLKECLHIYEQARSNSSLTSNTKSLLGWALMGQQKYAEAEPLLLAGYEGMKQTDGSIRPLSTRPDRLPDALQRLIGLYIAWDKPEEAAKWQKTLDEHKALPNRATAAVKRP